MAHITVLFLSCACRQRALGRASLRRYSNLGRRAHRAGHELRRHPRGRRTPRREASFGGRCGQRIELAVRYLTETMSQEIDDFIRSVYDRFNAGERMPSADDWHTDGVYVNSSEDPDPGIHRGLDAIAKQIQTWIETY